mgnify:FL=1
MLTTQAHLILLVFKFMEIKLKLTNHFLIFFGLLLSIHTNADLVDKIVFKKIEVENTFKPEITKRSLNQKNPLKDINIDVSKIIVLPGDKIISTNFNELNKKASNQNQLNGIKLLPGQYIEIIGLDKKRKLFNGALIVQFDNNLDFKNFAESNDLTLMKNLSDINTGVFKIKNILDVEIIINQLKEIENILRIDLDTIDPTIKPK